MGDAADGGAGPGLEPAHGQGRGEQEQLELLRPGLAGARLRLPDQEHRVDGADARSELELADRGRAEGVHQCRRGHPALPGQGRRPCAVDARDTTFFQCHQLRPNARASPTSRPRPPSSTPCWSRACPAELNAALEHADGAKADGNASALQARIKQKCRSREAPSASSWARPTRPTATWNNDRGWSTSTPVSDGTQRLRRLLRRHQGRRRQRHQPASTSRASACWSHFTGQTEVYEHGQHSTPVLSGNDSGPPLGQDAQRLRQGHRGKVRWTPQDLPASATSRASARSPSRPAASMSCCWSRPGSTAASDGAELWALRACKRRHHHPGVPAAASSTGSTTATAPSRPRTASYYALRLPPL
jgi:hypothetical protein